MGILDFEGFTLSDTGRSSHGQSNPILDTQSSGPEVSRVRGREKWLRNRQLGEECSMGRFDSSSSRGSYAGCTIASEVKLNLNFIFLLIAIRYTDSSE